MRVLQVMEATLGGTRRYLEDVAQACRGSSSGNGLAYSLVRADDAFRTLLQKLKANGWETFEIPMRRGLGFHDVNSIAELRRVCKSFEPDIIHAHSSKAGGLARMATIGLRSKPAIAYSPNSIAVELSRAYEFAERLLASRLDALVAVGPSERTQLESLKLVPASRIPIVVPTIDTDYFQPRDRSAARVELGYDDRPLVVCAGRLAAQKDPLGFVKLVGALRKRIPNVRGLWVGDGDLRDKFEEALRAANLFESVSITGWVTDVRPYLAAADLFVSTSAYESFGYVTAEAFASARAVVASAITGTVDIVKTDKPLQLYKPGDFEEAARLAATFLSDPALAALVGARGRESVVAAFAQERTRLQLTQAYDLAMKHRYRGNASRLTQLLERTF